MRTQVKIKLFGGLRRIAGGTKLEASGTTIQEVLESLCAANESLRTAIFAGNELQQHVRVMVNGHDCELADGLETTVTDQDTIAIFPPITGG